MDPSNESLPPLDNLDRSIYEWQMWAQGVGELGQRKLKGARVLISRVGGLGGIVAYQLAAAGVGKLVLAHAGRIRPSDLNRQLLMTYDQLGESRIESARRRLLELNPRLNIEAFDENISSENANMLVSKVDIVVDCAPLFEERYAMNRAVVEQGKMMVESAMYEFEGSLTTIVPGKTACLACISPTPPNSWRREFPVFGAVSGTVGCLAAMEVIKVITGVGQPLFDRLLLLDTASMSFRTHRIAKNPNCECCSSFASHRKHIGP